MLNASGSGKFVGIVSIEQLRERLKSDCIVEKIAYIVLYGSQHTISRIATASFAADRAASWNILYEAEY